jgi:uncharacterized membrane protein YkvA (DUF1232 family)
MIVSQISRLLKETAYSPEDLGKVIGVSGMTLRRWLKKPPQAAVPRVYIPAIRDACYKLIAEGRLNPDLPAIRTILSELPSGEYQAALRNLGLRHGFEIDRAGSEDQILTGLFQIGSQAEKQTEVEENSGKVFSFKKLGDEWSGRITTLWRVIHSKDLAFPDKVVAYGALFYLLTPIDFIPDHIPFFGLLDDFGVLGIAVAYYAKRFGGGL